MRTFIADIIPKIQRFSQRLDDLTKLTNQHWVSLGDINQSKKVYIFRPNDQLLISDNGIVEKGSWEYLGNQSLLLNTKNENYLLKHGFFDENVIALKLDSTNAYAFFVNETKYEKELNNIDDILFFLEKTYLKSNSEKSGINSSQKSTINQANDKFEYRKIGESKDFDLIWGKHIVYNIEFASKKKGEVYKGAGTGKYFFSNYTGQKVYCKGFEDAVYNLYLVLHNKNNR